MSDASFDIVDEVALLQQALKENEDLFSEVKTHYDKVKGAGTGAPLGFIEKQTANLVSLRSGKVSIIQQMINAKKTKAEMQIKIANANNGEDGASALIKEVSEQMYDLILAGKKDKSFNEILGGSQKVLDASPEDAPDVDAILEARIAEDDAKKAAENKEDDQPQSEATDDEGYYYVVDVQGNIYCLDADDNLIEDAPVPEVSITVQKIDTGEYVAFDEEGNSYDVVEFEEE
jgi:hypothetical protein